MVLYIPTFIEITLDEIYRKRGWTESFGCGVLPYPYSAPSGWKCDTSYPEVNGGVGTHGGCSYCVMIELQVIANYQTEVTFISNPPGAQIFIDGIEWWPGAVTGIDGATFRGISPAAVPTPHTYEMRMAGYISATGTFELVEGTPITVSGTLYSLASLGNVVIESIPSGAEIWLAPTGQTLVDQGITTVLGGTTIPNLLGGWYSYKLTLTGYLDSIGEIEILVGQTAILNVTMTALTPANIVATTIVPSVTTCTEPCNLTVDITWINNGQTTGTFTPTIIVNGTPTVLTLESLNFGQSITHTFQLIGLTAGTYNICADPNTLPCATVTVLTPANIISATLTVDINDCVAPCTVNGTVSWTNNGGSSGTLDPAILVNTIPTSLGPTLQINPGETLSYIFQLPGLLAGTYNIQASPNTGTVPQTITVRTPANIVATTIVPSVTTCTEPCNLTVDVTWINNGQTTGIFTPAIVVNGVSTPLIPENLSPGQSTIKTFQLTGLLAGIYNIQASPNAGTVPQTITVRTPANIVATTIVPSVTTCTVPCDVNVDITWINNGQTTGTFTPIIVVNDVSTPLIPENLSPGQSTIKTFQLTGLIAGTYNICADPNTLPCATVTVERAAVTTGGGAGMLLGIVGIVALGMMMTSKKSSEIKR